MTVGDQMSQRLLTRFEDTAEVLGDDLGDFDGPSLFRRWTTRELLDTDRTFHWTLRGMLVHPTYGMIGGPRKSLKSYIGSFIDLAIATGVPVFDHFAVDEMGAVLLYVGEGGRVPYTRRLERIASAMGIGRLGDVPLFTSFDVAPIGSARFFSSLRRDLADLEPTLVHIDPLYAFHPSAVNASNLFEEGAMLTGLSAECMAAEASCLVTTHFNKTGIGAGLDRITQAGGQEWSDSWILVAPRSEPDVANGEFHLTLDIGSRQWGGSSWALDLDLGHFDEDLQEFDGAISWDLHRAGGQRGASTEERLVAIIKREPGMLSREAVATALGGNRVAARKAIDQALTRGRISCAKEPVIRADGKSYMQAVYRAQTDR